MRTPGWPEISQARLCPAGDRHIEILARYGRRAQGGVAAEVTDYEVHKRCPVKLRPQHLSGHDGENNRTLPMRGINKSSQSSPAVHWAIRSSLVEFVTTPMGVPVPQVLERS